ncbi:MAG: hypothetical protein R2881_04415 [Eubacteriales bacterium]
MTRSISGRAQAGREREAEDLRKGADAQVILTDAMHQAVVEREDMLKELRSQTADLAVDIAGKILEREVKQEDHQRIIDSFFDKIRCAPSSEPFAAPLDIRGFFSRKDVSEEMIALLWTVR